MYRLRLALVAFVLASLALGTPAIAASGYTLFGDAQIVSGGNPGNAAQIRSDMSRAPFYGGVDFDITAGMTVADLTSLSTDYKFTQGSCSDGAPRFQINVITPAGPTRNIFVYIGPPPNYTLCPPNVFTNTGNLVAPLNLVDASQLGGAFYMPWAAVVAAYGSYPVTGIQVVTDTGYKFADGVQTVLVDNVQINDDTYTFESKDSCKNGGWRDFGTFKNQGECVSFYARG
jgi:hypothetical protein